MNEVEKGKYLEERCDLIIGCVVTKLETERFGDSISLMAIRLRHPNGNEFTIIPYNIQELRIDQTMWGY